MTIEDIVAKTGIEENLALEMKNNGRLKQVSAGETVIFSNSETTEIPIVLSGVLSVMRRDEHGNQLFLYYLEGGDTCAMSITCCLEDKKGGVSVLAEEDSLLWMIPSRLIEEWVQKYSNFRRFIFRSYQSRFDELLEAIDSIAFMNMDQRLYKYLLDKKQASGDYIIRKTHEQIANDLNTSRVVISRLLKQMEKEEKIEQKRNRIEIL